MVGSILSDPFKQNFNDTVLLIGGLAGIVVAIGTIHVKVVKPIVKAAKLLVHRWEAIDNHDDMLATVTADVSTLTTTVSEIKKDLEPTNGDRSTLSSRLDTVRHAVNSLKDDMEVTRDRVFETTKRLNKVENMVALVADRQNAHRNLTAQIARASNVNSHQRVDNFAKLGRWMKNFEQFEPVEFALNAELIPEEEIHRLGEVE